MLTTPQDPSVASLAGASSAKIADTLSISGRFLRTAQRRSETFEPFEEPGPVLRTIRESRLRADLYTFSQPLSEPEAKYDYYFEPEPIAMLEIESFEQWWKGTVNDKTRNMVRKASKKGVQLGLASYDDDFVRGIKSIYDECPIRQGKKSRHFGKSLELLKKEHATFLGRSEFIAARLDGRLIGFAKVVYMESFASILNLIALLGERDKAPTNALLAKAVERCADRGLGLLHYGVWSRRGFGDFKMHHGFECRRIPRYYVPLTAKGALALRTGLHRPLTARVPEGVRDWFAQTRARWYALRYPIT